MLVAQWSVGPYRRSADIAPIDPADPGVRQILAALTQLSHRLWWLYARPYVVRDRDGWTQEYLDDHQREINIARERAGVSALIGNVLDPHVPSEDGFLLQSLVPSEEIAHHLGRLLLEVDPALREAVITEVRAELTAVAAAELGDFSDRAVQGITISRIAASPPQVEAAHTLLEGDIFGPPELQTDVDLTSAAVAAADWLVAAAECAGVMAQLPTSQVLRVADGNEWMPPLAMTVIDALERGETSWTVVTTLIRDAVELSEGLVRVSDLDLANPALHLLEDLLIGIRGCWDVWSTARGQELIDDLDLNLDEIEELDPMDWLPEFKVLVELRCDERRS